MSIRAVSVLTCMLVVAMSTAAFAAEGCPPLPPTLTFSKNYSQAVATLASKGPSANLSLSGTALPSIGFDGGASSNSSININEAESLVSRDIKSERAQIVLGCVHYACALGKSGSPANSLAALSVMQEICTRAFDGERGSLGGVSFSPAYDLFVLKSQQAEVRAFDIANSTSGSIQFSAPTTRGPVAIRSEALPGLLPEHSTKTVRVCGWLPDGEDSSTAIITVHPSSDPRDVTALNLIIVRDQADLRPPARIECGKIQPNTGGGAGADIPYRKQNPPGEKFISDHTQFDVPETRSKILSVGVAYPQNGGSASDVNGYAECKPVAGSATRGETTVSFAFDLHSKGGTGNGTGGSAKVAPKWISSVHLPGTRTWTIKVSGHNNMVGDIRRSACSIIIGGVQRMIPSSAPFQERFDGIDASQDHDIEWSCGEVDAGSLPPQEHRGNLSAEISVVAIAEPVKRKSRVPPQCKW